MLGGTRSAEAAASQGDDHSPRDIRNFASADLFSPQHSLESAAFAVFGSASDL